MGGGLEEEKEGVGEAETSVVAEGVGDVYSFCGICMFLLVFT
jgi:hypothetical protein